MSDIENPSRGAVSVPVGLEYYRTHPAADAKPGGETVQPPPEWRIPLSVYCLHCGYDLRGLPRGLPCSECGRPVDWAGHAEAVGTYYRGGWLKTQWGMLNFFHVLPHGLWAMRDPTGRGWSGRRWKSFALFSLAGLLIGMFPAGGVFVESRAVVWFERGSESTAPVVKQISTKKFLGGWGIVNRRKVQAPVAPGPDWIERGRVERRLRLSGVNMTQDGVILLALTCPLVLAAMSMGILGRLILRFSAIDHSSAENRRWLRDRLYPTWLAFPPAALLVAFGMTIQLSWSMWPVWIPEKVKELAVVWTSNGALLVPAYFAMRILSADYTRRLFPNRWYLGGFILACLVTIPWTAGQVLYWVTMSIAYPIGGPLARLPSLWPF